MCWTHSEKCNIEVNSNYKTLMMMIGVVVFVCLFVVVVKRPAGSKELFPDCLKVKLSLVCHFLSLFTMSRGYWGTYSA